MTRKYLLIFPLILIIILLATSRLSGQQTADKYIDGMIKKMDKIKDYAVDARIVVDMPFIKILPVNAQYFYKQKNKFKVKSKNLALLPKQTYWQNLSFLEKKNTYTSVISGTEKLAGFPELSIISVIPSQDTGDLILVKFWLDPVENLLYKSQLTTRTNGTILTEYYYTVKNSWGLPDKLVFTVDVKKFKIPKGIATDLNKSKTTENKNQASKRSGKIEVSLRNYKVNQGLNDEIFK